jgi:hypothetical protein
MLDSALMCVDHIHRRVLCILLTRVTAAVAKSSCGRTGGMVFRSRVGRRMWCYRSPCELDYVLGPLGVDNPLSRADHRLVASAYPVKRGARFYRQCLSLIIPFIHSDLFSSVYGSLWLFYWRTHHLCFLESIHRSGCGPRYVDTCLCIPPVNANYCFFYILYQRVHRCWGHPCNTFSSACLCT